MQSILSAASMEESVGSRRLNALRYALTGRDDMLKWLDKVGDAFDAVRFGSDGDPSKVSTSSTAPSSLLQVSVPPLSPGKRLQDLPGLFRAIGRIPPDAVEEALKPLSRDAAKQVGTAIENAPTALFRVVRDAIEEVATTSASKSDSVFVSGLRRTLMDPRSAQEAAMAMEKVIGQISLRPAVERMVNETLEVLEDKGVLGSETLRVIAKLGLAALGVGGAQVVQYMVGGKVGIGTKGFSSRLDKTADAFIGLDKLGSYAGSLRLHDPKWAGAAVEMVVKGQHRGLALPSEASGVKDRLPTVESKASFPLVRRPNLSLSAGPSVAVNLEGDSARAKLHGLLSARRADGARISANAEGGLEVSREGAPKVLAGAGVSASTPLDVRGGTSLEAGLSGSVEAEVGRSAVPPEIEGLFTTTVRF